MLQDVTRSWYKNLPRDLTRISTRSSIKDLHGIMQGPCRKDFITISARSSLKDLRKIIQPSSRMSAGSSQDLLIRTCTRFNHTRARAISKFAPRHNESDLTRQKSREGCANDIKIRTKPQQGRSDCSDTPKVMRGLRKRCQNSHRATTRGIWHAKSHERAVQAISKFAPHHNEGDLTALTRGLRERDQNSHRTSPQRERSNTCKVTRELHGTKPRRPSCASLCNRNAHWHVARELLCENLQWKSRGPDGAPWSNPPAFYPYRKNPSVWTHVDTLFGEWEETRAWFDSHLSIGWGLNFMTPGLLDFALAS